MRLKCHIDLQRNQVNEGEGYATFRGSGNDDDKMCGITLRDKRKSVELRNRLNIESVEDVVVRGRFEMF